MNTPELELHFAVVGRHHGDEEDTLLFVRAPSSTLAIQGFKDALNELRENHKGLDVYVNHVLCSLTPLFESDADAQAVHQIQDPDLAERVIKAAETHGADSDPDHEVGDLQDVVRGMWKLMVPHQRVALMRMQEVQKVFEAAYLDEFPDSLDGVGEEAIRTALTSLGLDPEASYPDQLKLDAVLHTMVLPSVAERYVYCDSWHQATTEGQNHRTRWALDTGTMQLIDAQYESDGEWHTLSAPDCKSLLESIVSSKALDHRNLSMLEVSRAKTVADFPDWVGAEPMRRPQERPAG